MVAAVAGVVLEGPEVFYVWPEEGEELEGLEGFAFGGCVARAGSAFPFDVER